MVTELLAWSAPEAHDDGMPGSNLPLDVDEVRAIQLLARSGLVSGRVAALARARPLDSPGRCAVG